MVTVISPCGINALFPRETQGPGEYWRIVENSYVVIIRLPFYPMVRYFDIHPPLSLSLLCTHLNTVYVKPGLIYNAHTLCFFFKRIKNNFVWRTSGYRSNTLQDDFHPGARRPQVQTAGTPGPGLGPGQPITKCSFRKGAVPWASARWWDWGRKNSSEKDTGQTQSPPVWSQVLAPGIEEESDGAGVPKEGMYLSYPTLTNFSHLL